MILSVGGFLFRTWLELRHGIRKKQKENVLTTAVVLLSLKLLSNYKVKVEHAV